MSCQCGGNFCLQTQHLICFGFLGGGLLGGVWILGWGRAFLFGIFKLLYNNELEVMYLIFYFFGNAVFLDSKQSWFVFIIESILKRQFSGDFNIYSMFCCFSERKKKKDPSQHSQPAEVLPLPVSNKKIRRQEDQIDRLETILEKQRQESMLSRGNTKSLVGDFNSKKSLKKFQNIQNDPIQEETFHHAQSTQRTNPRKITTFGKIQESGVRGVKAREKISKNIDRFEDVSDSHESRDEDANFSFNKLEKKKKKKHKSVKIAQKFEEVHAEEQKQIKQADKQQKQGQERKQEIEEGQNASKAKGENASVYTTVKTAQFQREGQQTQKTIKSQEFQLDIIEQVKSSFPKIEMKQTQSLQDLGSKSSRFQESFIISSSKNQSGTNQSVKTDNMLSMFDKTSDKIVEEDLKETQITLDNFKLSLKQISRKIEEELDDQPLEESMEEALLSENDFYCQIPDINQQFSRSVVAYETQTLAKIIFKKMTVEQINKKDSKGYTPIQLLVFKAFKHKNYVQLAKTMAYHEHTNLQCKDPAGWTPLQSSLIQRNITLASHLFKAGYMKRQQKFALGLSRLGGILKEMPDFRMDIHIKVDSFLPLVGALAPDDTLRLRKVGNKMRIDYSLVGYQFPFCKRRDMSLFFDGAKMFGVNYSKNTYCDLLEPLDQEQMIMLVQDLLVSEIRKGQPIVHEIKLNKTLSLFDNEITQTFGNIEATKHKLELKYSSTADKRRSGDVDKDLANWVDNYERYVERREEVVVLEKNRDKKVELELWLTKKFGLELNTLVQVLGIMGEGNNLLSKWSGFIRDKLGDSIIKDKLFPVKIDIPLNYSLYFNIEFQNYTLLPRWQPQIQLKQTLLKIPRKKFQNLHQNKEKRKLFLQAYT